MLKQALLAACLLSLPLDAANAGLFTKYFERKDDEQCQSYGAVPGSDAYINCRLALHQRRVQALDNFGQQLQYQNQLQQQRNFEQQLLLQQNRPLNCTSQRFGNMVRTNCY